MRLSEDIDAPFALWECQSTAPTTPKPNMVRLKDREKQIPGGLTYYESALKWRPPPYSSFDVITRSLVQLRRANPFLAKKNGWSTDYNDVAALVDFYNAKICQAHGWDQYITDSGGPPNPKMVARSSNSSLSQGVVHAAAGANIIMDMFGPEGPIRDRELAEKRASICVECPMNGKGDWTRFFTVPAQAIIRKALGIVKDMDLTTGRDADLRVCTVCNCPLKGKVYARLKHIHAHLPPADKAKLPPTCWILTEQ